MKRTFLLIMALLCQAAMWAGSDTDYSKYHYRPQPAFNTWSGTATIVLQVFDGHKVNENVEVAVFTKADTPVLRGVAQYDSLNAVWWMTVHGDISEPMEFHLWDSCKCKEKIVDQDWTFKVNGIEGTRHNPYKLYWNKPRSIYENSLQVNATTLRTENGNTCMIPVNLLNPSDKVSAVSFDLTLPEGIGIKYDDAYWVFKGSRTSATKQKGSRSVNVFNEPAVQLNDGVYHIDIAATDASSAIEGTSGDILELYLTLDNVLDDGIYYLFINNVVLTMTDGQTGQTDDFMASLIVMGPDGSFGPVATISGAVTPEYMDDITGNAEILGYDMTEAYLTEGITFSPANPNALLYVNPYDSTKLASNVNIVSDGKCDSLVLVDGSQFCALEDFSVDVAIFTRDFPDLGTICLPFAPGADGFDFYQLSEETETYLRFTKVDSPMADVPYLYHRTVSCDTVKAYNVDIAAAGAGEQDACGSWTFHGTYSTLTFEATDDVYAITDNKLYYNTGTLTVQPFRAFFTKQGGSQVPVMNLKIDGLTGICEIVLSKENPCYNIQGVTVPDSFSGIVIKDGKKTFRR